MKGPLELQIFMGGVVVVFPFSGLESTNDGVLSFILKRVGLCNENRRGKVE